MHLISQKLVSHIFSIEETLRRTGQPVKFLPILARLCFAISKFIPIPLFHEPEKLSLAFNEFKDQGYG